MSDPMAMLLIADTMIASTSVLAAVYIVCLIVGGGLLALSTLLGGHADSGTDTDIGVHLDTHVDAGVHGDMDAHVDGSGEIAGHTDGLHGHGGAGSLSLATWFSIRFVVYFLAVFGLLGTALTYLSDFGSTPVLVTALGGGLIVGQCVHQLLRLLARTSANSAPLTCEYVDKPARVTAAIVPPDEGEVSVAVGGGTRFVPAVAQYRHHRFKTGDSVVIVAFKRGVAEVLSEEDYRFLRESQPQ